MRWRISSSGLVLPNSFVIHAANISSLPYGSTGCRHHKHPLRQPETTQRQHLQRPRTDLTAQQHAQGLSALRALPDQLILRTIDLRDRGLAKQADQTKTTSRTQFCPQATVLALPLQLRGATQGSAWPSHCLPLLVMVGVMQFLLAVDQSHIGDTAGTERLEFKAHPGIAFGKQAVADAGQLIEGGNEFRVQLQLATAICLRGDPVVALPFQYAGQLLFNELSNQTTIAAQKACQFRQGRVIVDLGKRVAPAERIIPGGDDG